MDMKTYATTKARILQAAMDIWRTPDTSSEAKLEAFEEVNASFEELDAEFDRDEARAHPPVDGAPIETGGRIFPIQAKRLFWDGRAYPNRDGGCDEQ